MNNTKSTFFVLFAVSILLVMNTGVVFGLTQEELIQALKDLESENAQIELNAQEALALIKLANEVGVPFPTGTVVLTVTGMHQGTSSQNAVFDTTNWLEYCMIMQDGNVCGTTQQIRSTFQQFIAFDNSPLFSFAPSSDPLRTLLALDVRTVTDFSKIGTDFCFDFPRPHIQTEIRVNGVLYDLPNHGLIPNGFNESTQIYSGFGNQFNPQLVERLLEQLHGVTLKTGDTLVWKTTVDNRYTIWRGQITGTDPRTGEQSCGVTGELAFDAYAVGMVFQMKLKYIDPIDLVSIPVTDQPDTDGDGIPDSIDQCTFERESFNNFQDEDGCFDIAPDFDIEIPISVLEKDTDNDGIPDIIDQCTYFPETFNGIDDEDGCPDGSVIENVFVEPSDPIIELTGQFGVSPQENPTNIEALALVEDNPDTNIGVNPEDVSGENPDTKICNSFLDDCNEIIAQAIRTVELATGIRLPFAPTTLNFVFLFIGFSTAVLIILKVFKKI